jgi:hypothetical protein
VPYHIKQIWQALKRRLQGTGLSPAAEPLREQPANLHEKPDLQANLAGLKAELEQYRLLDEQQLEELRRRVGVLESERDTAREQVNRLRVMLSDMASRQEQAEIHANTLDIQLSEQRTQHQAALQDALIRERRQARRITLAMTIAGAAFVLALVFSVTGLLESSNNADLLAGINQGIRDIQTTIEHQQAIMLQQQAAAHTPRAIPEIPPTEISMPMPTGDTATSPSAPLLPEPDFVVTGSLPVAGHGFRSRQDVRSFFEENARQPGVVTLPGGVQYRVLIPGDGSTPSPSDTVVIEYRAFRPDGTELDSSFREQQPSTFLVSEAIPGLREALQHMQENAQWELYIPPALISEGVRKRGKFGFEPLIYTVELLSVVSAQSPITAE